MVLYPAGLPTGCHQCWLFGVDVQHWVVCAAVRYHDCFSDGFKLHIVMEWAEGGDMQGLISRHAKAGTRLTEEQLLTHYVQVSKCVC